MAKRKKSKNRSNVKANKSQNTIKNKVNNSKEKITKDNLIEMNKVEINKVENPEIDNIEIKNTTLDNNEKITEESNDLGLVEINGKRVIQEDVSIEDLDPIKVLGTSNKDASIKEKKEIRVDLIKDLDNANTLINKTAKEGYIPKIISVSKIVFEKVSEDNLEDIENKVYYIDERDFKDKNIRNNFISYAKDKGWNYITENGKFFLFEASKDTLDIFNTDIDFELQRIKDMKLALIILLVSLILFFLAFKIAKVNKLVGLLGIIPAIVVGFTTAWLFKLIMKKSI